MKLYTTGEYIGKLKRYLKDETKWTGDDKFSVFKSKKEAQDDAEWYVRYQQEEHGKTIKCPKLYVIKFEEM